MDLSALMIGEACVAESFGAALVRDGDGPGPALDLVEAALLEGDPAAEKARLRSRGFVRARISTWRSEHVTLSITLYELRDGQQAALAVLDVVEALRAAAARIGTVGGHPGAELDGVLVSSFAVGSVHAVIVLVGGPIAALEAVVAAQHRLLG
jgi:hypothetical protein